MSNHGPNNEVHCSCTIYIYYRIITTHTYVYIYPFRTSHHIGGTLILLNQEAIIRFLLNTQVTIIIFKLRHSNETCLHALYFSLPFTHLISQGYSPFVITHEILTFSPLLHHPPLLKKILFTEQEFFIGVK